MHDLNVSGHRRLLVELSVTKVTLEPFDVTNAVLCGYVNFQMLFSGQSLSANLARMRSYTAFRSRAVSVRRIVVSADRRLVVERHVT